MHTDARYKIGIRNDRQHFETCRPDCRVIGCFYDVYHELGHGFLESVYRETMVLALVQKDLLVEREKTVLVTFRGVTVGMFRADLVVDDRVILELKTARGNDSAHEAQLLNYLKATKYEIRVAT